MRSGEPGDLKLDAIRFCIGPWKGRYSSIWRIWSNPGSDDIYLGVRCLLQSLKISLHQSGKFRAAFVESYHDRLVADGKDPSGDRAFMKWDKIAVTGGTIMQALDIHFPLSTLSLSEEPSPIKSKKQFILKPHEESLSVNDTVTVKILFHKAHPESDVIRRAFANRNIIPMFWLELANGEYVSFVSAYTKKLPIDFEKKEMQKFANQMGNYFKKNGDTVGAKISNLTMQMFRMNMPPEIYNIGNMSVHWKDENNIIISKDD